MGKPDHQRLLYGTRREIRESIVDILTESRQPMLAEEIWRELKHRGLDVKDIRSISMTIRYDLSEDVNRVMKNQLYLYSVDEKIKIETNYEKAIVKPLKSDGLNLEEYIKYIE
jgi:uncharacterized protein (UPF0335 family)